jgi:Polyprenyl synthetase
VSPAGLKRGCGSVAPPYERATPARNGAHADANPYETLLASCRESLKRAGSASGWPTELTELVTGGKLLRPLLLVSSASAVGGRPERLLHAAEAMELLHTASLVHDDIVDDTDQRRERAALHRTVGTDVALVAGDLLLTTAFSRLAAAPEDADPARVVRAVRVFAECAALCCDGELAELAPNTRGPSTYVSIARRKTASQFVAAATIGGLLAGGSEEELRMLSEYGESLGIAFQIDDDLRDRGHDSIGRRLPTGLATAGRRRTVAAAELRTRYAGRALRSIRTLDCSPGRDVLDELAHRLGGGSHVAHDR